MGESLGRRPALHELPEDGHGDTSCGLVEKHHRDKELPWVVRNAFWRMRVRMGGAE